MAPKRQRRVTSHAGLDDSPRPSALPPASLSSSSGMVEAVTAAGSTSLAVGRQAASRKRQRSDNHDGDKRAPGQFIVNFGTSAPAAAELFSWADLMVDAWISTVGRTAHGIATCIWHLAQSVYMS